MAIGFWTPLSHALHALRIRNIEILLGTRRHQHIISSATSLLFPIAPGLTAPTVASTLFKTQAMAAAADCTLPIALAASGWVVAAGLAIYNTKSLFDYPVSDEPDSPQEGDPSGQCAASKKLLRSCVILTTVAEHLKVYSPCSRSINIASSASGFCGKVETFCRLAGIPYTRHNGE